MTARSATLAAAARPIMGAGIAHGRRAQRGLPAIVSLTSPAKDMARVQLERWVKARATIAALLPYQPNLAPIFLRCDDEVRWAEDALSDDILVRARAIAGSQSRTKAA